MGENPGSSTVSSGLHGLLYNPAFLSAFCSFVVAQVAKIFTHFCEEGVWDLHRLIGSGGMPSSHTAFVMGLTTSVGVQHGVDSSIFALCLVFTLVVMYDASGVRLHAGKQASVLNLIVLKLPADHPAQEAGRLRDTLGHTPLQVCMGALVGLVGGYVFQTIWNSHSRA